MPRPMPLPRPWDAPPIPACPGPACRDEPLDVFQPHPSRPEVIFGYCGGCNAIYRLRSTPGGAGWGVDAAARLVPAGSEPVARWRLAAPLARHLARPLLLLARLLRRGRS